MKISKVRSKMTAPAWLAAVLVLPCLLSVSASAQTSNEPETQMDLAADVGKYFGQRANLYRDNNRKLAKVDLDADLNYDGEVSNTDPADGGAFESTPPGLVVGVGELAKIVIRITPYKIDYEGRAKVSLRVDGINRDNKQGKFAEGEEAAGMGHIRVWRDSTKKEKILDSRDPNLRSFEWTLDSRDPTNIQVVPRTLYVEGVSSSPHHLGDIRLLLSVYDDNPNYEVNPKYDPRRWIKTFRPSYDHLLLTVQPKPHMKAFVNNNAEGVWLPGK